MPPNPFYDPLLRPLTGPDTPVMGPIQRQPATGPYLSHTRFSGALVALRFERDPPGYVWWRSVVRVGSTGLSIWWKRWAALFA